MESWSEGDVEKLIEMSSNGKKLSEIAVALNKPREGVRVKARRLGINLKDRAKYGWSPEEDAILIEKYDEVDDVDTIAEEIGRSRQNICGRAMRLGLRRTRAKHMSPNFHGTSESAKKHWAQEGAKADLSKRMKEYWSDDAHREAQSVRITAIHAEASKEEKEKRAQACRDARLRTDVVAKLRGAQKNGSSIERILWGILGDLGLKEGIDWEKHFQVGHYQFDVLLKRQDKKSILIEANGDYWHTAVDRVCRSDKSKATYIEKYFSDKYELKTVWEHEFLAEGRIAGLVKTWLGLNEFNPFDFKDVTLEEISVEDAKKFLEKYHYSGGLGRGGVSIGAYLPNRELAAVAVFSTMIRQNISQMWGMDNKEVRELSRLAIKADRQIKNFASWFLTRAVGMVKEKLQEVKMLVSYADATYNHLGTVYKASNWTLDGETPEDYWYVDKEGYVTGKRALYRHATRMSMKEAEYAEQKGLVKVYGGKKFRYILNIVR